MSEETPAVQVHLQVGGEERQSAGPSQPLAEHAQPSYAAVTRGTAAAKKLMEDPRLTVLLNMTEAEQKALPFSEVPDWLQFAREATKALFEVRDTSDEGYARLESNGVPLSVPFAREAPRVDTLNVETARGAPASYAGTSVVSGKLPLPTLSRFSGHGSQSLTEWIADAQTVTALSGVDEVAAVKYAALHLSDYAKKVWISALPYLSDTPFTWALLVSTLQKGLGVQNHEWNARERLASLRQTTTVQAYALRFSELADSLSEPLSGADKIFKFIKGLKPNLQKACLVDPSNQNQIWKPQDFDKLISYALNLETGLSALQLVEKVERGEHRMVLPRAAPTVRSAGSDGAAPAKRAKTGWKALWPADLAEPTVVQRQKWAGKCFLCKAKGKNDESAKHSIYNCSLLGSKNK